MKQRESMSASREHASACAADEISELRKYIGMCVCACVALKVRSWH